MTPAVVHQGRAEQLNAARRHTSSPLIGLIPNASSVEDLNPLFCRLRLGSTLHLTREDRLGTTFSGWSIPGVPPFSAPRNEISIQADVDKNHVTSLLTPIEAH